jgi:hypothetical protein
MDTILVACETIEDEIKRSLAERSLNYPIIWLEGGLHNIPDRLRGRLQEVFDQADGKCQRLLMALGYCGGGVSELKTGDYQTVIPLVDDCISLLLGSLKARKKASRPATYFLTAGWMRHENNVIRSYHQMIEKYGQTKADRINKIMLKNYKRFGVIDTGCFDLEEAAQNIKPLADLMEMTIEPLQCERSWLELLVTGPHDDPSLFLCLPPKTVLNYDQWCPLLMGEIGQGFEVMSGQLTESAKYT